MNWSNRMGLALMILGIFGLVIQIFIVADGYIITTSHAPLLLFALVLELFGMVLLVR